jgi:hypothetical protein
LKVYQWFVLVFFIFLQIILKNLKSGPWFSCEKEIENNKKEYYCCTGMAVELLSLVAEGSKRINNGERIEEKNEKEEIYVDNSFSFVLKINESYGVVLLEEGEEKNNEKKKGFKLTGMVF